MAKLAPFEYGRQCWIFCNLQSNYLTETAGFNTYITNTYYLYIKKHLRIAAIVTHTTRISLTLYIQGRLLQLLPMLRNNSKPIIGVISYRCYRVLSKTKLRNKVGKPKKYWTERLKNTKWQHIIPRFFFKLSLSLKKTWTLQKTDLSSYPRTWCRSVFKSY